MLDIINWYGVLYVLGKGSYLYTYTTNTLYTIHYTVGENIIGEVLAYKTWMKT